MKRPKKGSVISDILAGLTVSFAALSLGAAFGIMSGRGAFAGMLGAAIIPIVASLFGGTRVQASGPTAPMTAVTAVITAYAYENFPGDKALAEQFVTMVILLSAGMIMLMGVFRLGRFIAKIPQVVVLGFMNGIAVLIWIDQIRVLFGMGSKEPLTGGIGVNLAIVALVLLLIFGLPILYRKLEVPEKVRRFIPSLFMTIVIITIGTTLLQVDAERVSLGGSVETLSAFKDIVLSYFPQDEALFSSEFMLEAMKYAMQLCLLAYLDSLLTALVVDRLTGEKSKFNKELLAQGLANGVAGIVQAIPGAQATIRSVLLIKEGATRRISGVMVGVFALLGFLVFSKLIVLITSAVFVGVLFKVGLDVMDRDFFRAYFKMKWYQERKYNIQLGIIIYTTLMTVIFDLNIAVISATIIYYVGAKFLNFSDVGSEMTEAHIYDHNLAGREMEE